MLPGPALGAELDWIEGSGVLGRACALEAQPVSSANKLMAPGLGIENILGPVTIS